ncbi:hypothetical protein FOZ62_000916 [Perkinsus olseni]|uniref:Non-haem dioxygenase N-terminal domain-containing protein n=1 Tax=Perkinsus olseni TaxID=32597 RepID=A0A7J6RAB2_PEROL|nr:hypothetical protein FOZ62_000916 [Perkinsus olseni]
MGQHDPEDNPAKRHEPSDDIPRVSLAGAVANPHDIDVLRSLSREVSAAMEKYGCFIIVNHGVPREVCQDVEQTSKEFFDLPVEVKNEVLATADDFEGYDAGGELLYTSEETEEHLKDTRGQADAKESYQIWPSTSSYPGSTRSGMDKMSLAYSRYWYYYFTLRWDQVAEIATGFPSEVYGLLQRDGTTNKSYLSTARHRTREGTSVF